MSAREQYEPGPAYAEVKKDGDAWTLVLVRDLHHAPEKVWEAITDPEHIRQWAPYDADGSLGVAGANVNLTTFGAPGPHITETTITRADAPKVLEYSWGGGPIRWQLEPASGGTRLTLWAQIDKNWIAMGAAGWQICLDVLDRSLGETPMDRIAGPEAMQNPAWQKLNAEYSKLFGVAAPSW